MKLSHLLLVFFLSLQFALAEVTFDQLNALFHDGKFEAVVIEGEILGKRYQAENNKEMVARVYQVLTIAYMRLGREDDMMRANAISKGAFADKNSESTDPVVKQRAICDRASSLFSAGDLPKTVSFVDQHLAQWPADSNQRFYLYKPKFHALAGVEGVASALASLELEKSAVEKLLAQYPQHKKPLLENLFRLNLLASEATMFVEEKTSLEFGLVANQIVTSNSEIDIASLPGGPNLPFRLAAAGGRYEDALRLFRGYDNSFSSNSGAYRFGTEGRTAYWLEKLGRKREALDKYDQSIVTIDGAWSKLRVRQNKETFLAATTGACNFLPPNLIFQRAISLAFELGDYPQAFDYSEHFKSRSLRDSLSREKLEEINPPRVPAALLSDERRLFRRLSAKPEPAEVREYLAVLDKIQQLNPEYHELLVGNPGELRLPRLKPDELLVEYFVAEDKLFIFLLEHDKPIQGKIQPTTRAQLETRTIAVLKSIRRKDRLARLKPHLAALSKDLIAPIASALEGKKRVIFVPHGKLHYLPFSSLLDSEGRYLIETWEVTEAPSAHSLSFGQEKNRRREGKLQMDKELISVFALGDSAPEDWSALPGTEVESELIAGLFPQAKSFIGAEMTEANIRQQIGNSQLLHFATHGFLDRSDPLKSGLVTVDGSLTAGDIFQSQIPAYSVFLSACDSGVGKQSDADELVGLLQSFHYAGSPSVIATLWPISDRTTAQLVSEFYTGLGAESKGTSLRAAQLALLKKRRSSHPYYWAAFVLSGDWI